MGLITREEKGSKLTIEEMDGNLEYLEKLAKNGNFIDPREYILKNSKIELTDNNYIRIQPLENGEYILNNEDLLFPENEIYVLSTVETYLKFAEAVASNPIYLNNRKLNIVASAETYLKFAEATISHSYNNNNQTGFIEQFLQLINDPTYAKDGEIIRKSDLINCLIAGIYSSAGIVELGQIGEGSKLVYSHILKKLILGENSLVNLLGIQEIVGNDNDSTLRYILERLLLHGIVVREYKGNLIISSVESYLRWLEAEGGTPDYIQKYELGSGGGAVPA
jgi:hypothetical protein